jgi:hypothetical protein
VDVDRHVLYVCEIGIETGTELIDNTVKFELLEGGVAPLGVEAWGQPKPFQPAASWNLYSYLAGTRIMLWS